MKKPTIQEIEDAAENFVGWCSKCRAFTTESVEPDAKNYTCEECGEDSVAGVETALLRGDLS